MSYKIYFEIGELIELCNIINQELKKCMLKLLVY